MIEVVVRMDHTPRNCLECPLNGQCGIFADWVCTLNSLARKHYPQPFDKGCNILAVLPDRHGRLVDADDLCSRCRPVKNFEHEEMLVLGLGPLKCAKAIVPATKEEAE